MSSDNRRCETCDHWLRTSVERFDVGVCRRNPPRRTDGTAVVHRAFPYAMKTWRCGEWIGPLIGVGANFCTCKLPIRLRNGWCQDCGLLRDEANGAAPSNHYDVGDVTD